VANEQTTVDDVVIGDGLPHMSALIPICYATSLVARKTTVKVIPAKLIHRNLRSMLKRNEQARCKQVHSIAKMTA
jgi:hypothetical protein